MDRSARISTATAALTDQIGCADTIEPALLERVRHEVLTVPGAWVSGYSRFQSGGWGTLSLLNDTGNARDVTIGDTDPVPTDLLQRMPTTRALLGELGLKYMWARLALLGAGSYLWEHRDYQEDELTDAERHRVHIPITTTSSAFLVLGGSAVHLQAGKIWRLTPTFVHGACNVYGPARIHLILDCYADTALAAANRPEQFTVMDQTMRLLTTSPAVTHLVVRGSFVTGTSDRLSDVDLVVGIRADPGSNADDPQVEAFIAAQRQAPPTCSALLVEVLVLGWLIRKRIVRGQRFMAYKEAHQLTTPNGKVAVVDWAHASRGAAWQDVTDLVPHLVMAGHTPASAEAQLAGTVVWEAAGEEVLTSYAAAYAGYWTRMSRQPAPEGVPHLRAYQRRAAGAALAWVRHRCGAV